MYCSMKYVTFKTKASALKQMTQRTVLYENIDQILPNKLHRDTREIITRTVEL